MQKFSLGLHLRKFGNLAETEQSIAFATSWVAMSPKGANRLLVGMGETAGGAGSAGTLLVPGLSSRFFLRATFQFEYAYLNPSVRQCVRPSIRPSVKRELWHIGKKNKYSSDRDWASCGQTWKTGTERQYLRTLWSTFNHCDVTGQRSNRNRLKTQNKGYYAVQCH